MLTNYLRVTSVIFLVFLRQVLSDERACTIDPHNNYVDMCKDGCNKYIIYDYTRVLSLKDGSGGVGCNMTIQAEPGLGMIVKKGIVFFDDDPTCRARCWIGNFISFTDQSTNSCVCDGGQGDRLYSTSRNMLTVSYRSNFEFAINVQTVGCLTKTLSSAATSKKKNRIISTVTRGDPTINSSYVVKVECPEGFLVKQNYTFIENQCDVPLNGENRIGRWTVEGVGCTKVKCEAPMDIANGNYTPHYGNELYRYNDEIRYSCDAGYEMTRRGYRTRRCVGLHEEGSVFEGFPPVCTKKDCGEPAAITGQATLDGSGTEFESTRLISCSLGFNLNGPSVITCQENGTWSTPPSCDIVKCVQLPRVENAWSVVNSSPYAEGLGIAKAYGSIWTFTCNGAFRMIGNPKMTCREDGMWSEAPICTADRCEISGLPTSSEYSCADCDGNIENKVNATRTYRCLQGFSDAEVKVQCHRSGDWSPLPSCSRIDCNDPSPAENGKWMYNSSKYGDTAELDCDHGYQPYSDNRLTCAMSGEWVNGSSCKPVDCGSPATHPNATIRDAISSTSYKSVIVYVCKDGYFLADASNQVECQHSGVWSPLPTCEIHDCGRPTTTNIANGTARDFTDTVYGSEINFVCDHGFMFASSKAMKCLADGKWSGIPQCVVVDCKTPLNYTTASLSSYNGTGLGAEATYECLRGTKNEASRSVCNEDGTWSSPDCMKQPPGLGKMLYVYIGCGALVLIVILVVLSVGLYYRRKERRRRSKTRVDLLKDKSARRGDGSHCSNDSGLSVDRDPAEFEHAPSIGSYDYKTDSLAMKQMKQPSWSRHENSSPLPPYSTDSLSKPRSRNPISNGIPLVMMCMEEDIKNPLYGEQKTERRGSKNSSPCNFRQSPCTISAGMTSPPLNNFNHLHPDDGDNFRYQTISSIDRHGNIVDHSAPGTMPKYSTNPPLKVISGQELRPSDPSDTALSQDLFSENTLPTRNQYPVQSAYL